MKIDKIFKKYFDILTKIPPPRPVYKQDPPLFIRIIIYFIFLYLSFNFIYSQIKKQIKKQRNKYMLMNSEVDVFQVVSGQS